MSAEPAVNTAPEVSALPAAGAGGAPQSPAAPQHVPTPHPEPAGPREPAAPQASPPPAAPAPQQSAAPQQAPPTPAPATSATPAPGVRAGQPADARALFAVFAAMTGLEARFEEEKHLALLAAPLKTHGRLYFMPPGYMARVVEEPERSVVTITPTELRMTGAQGTETIDLRQNADVRLFVTSLVRVLSGDEAELQRAFAIAFESGPSGWTLELTPKAKPLSEMMGSLTLSGTGGAVSEMVLLESNGDRSVTRILEADTTRRFSAQEQTSLFGIPPR